MKRVHIIGGKNHGKTTLVVELVQELTKQGLRVGTIKHTHHHHELDTPGKDSHRHRNAGAEIVGICSRSMNAVFWPPKHCERDHDADAQSEKYEVFEPVYQQCDVVLVEGDTKTRGLKLEVWRREIGDVPLARSEPSISAVITDELRIEHVDVPLWPRTDLAVLVGNILSMIDL